jgi:hypothetical protein
VLTQVPSYDCHVSPTLRSIYTIRQIVPYDTIFTNRISPILSYDTFRRRLTQFSLISVGLCKYPVENLTRCAAGQ